MDGLLAGGPVRGARGIEQFVTDIEAELEPTRAHDLPREEGVDQQGSQHIR
jgi:hypothetical protein